MHEVKQYLCDLLNREVSDPALSGVQHGQSVQDGTVNKGPSSISVLYSAKSGRLSR